MKNIFIFNNNLRINIFIKDNYFLSIQSYKQYKQSFIKKHFPNHIIFAKQTGPKKTLLNGQTIIFVFPYALIKVSDGGWDVELTRPKQSRNQLDAEHSLLGKS